jgi:hypothetical protein
MEQIIDKLTPNPFWAKQHKKPYLVDHKLLCLIIEGNAKRANILPLYTL